MPLEEAWSHLLLQFDFKMHTQRLNVHSKMARTLEVNFIDKEGPTAQQSLERLGREGETECPKGPATHPYEERCVVSSARIASGADV